MNTSRENKKNKYKLDYGIRDVYDLYRDQQIAKGLKPVDRKVFRKVIYRFNKEICEAMVNNALEYKMPFRLGYLRVRKHKTKIKIDSDGKLITKHLKPDNTRLIAHAIKNNDSVDYYE